MRLKYGGAGGIPFISASVHSLSGIGRIDGLKRRSYPSDEDRREPIALPHSEPAPCDGNTSVKSGSVPSRLNTLS
jgi:hypothetical protein